jgi:16S rRNA (guanine966-N2)-methyltransferase
MSRKRGHRPPPIAETEGPQSVRVIGGHLRGRKIEYHGDPRTRPMKDRVREAVFNLLGDVSGNVAIDLFAGMGALGLEALSRGASRAIFLERHFPTADLLRRSAAALGVADACEIVPADTLVWFRKIAAMCAPAQGHDDGPRRPWLVFCSPPFDLYIDRADDMLALLFELSNAAPPESRLVVEADERFDFARLPHVLVWDLRTYPPAHIAIGSKDVEG